MSNNMLWLFITVAIGTISGVIVQRLKVPSGGLTGAMVGVIILNMATTGKAYMPVEIRLACQIISGAMVGCQITRKDLMEFGKIILPASLLILCMFILNLITGFALYKYGLDLTTALFSATPGGVTDMTLIADELGANTTYVSILHLSRLTGVLMISPMLIKWFYNKGWITGSPVFMPAEKAAKPSYPILKKERWIRIAGSISISVLGGVLATMLRIPAGGMVGSLLFAAMFNVITQKGHFPTKVRPAVRIAAGIFLGTRMQVSFSLLISCITPILILLAALITFSTIIAYLMHIYTGLDMGVCLLASSPAGMQEMVLISQELGIDAAKVAVMHLFRLVAVIMLFPVLLNFLLHFMA